MNLQGKIALVTGSGRGLGRAYALYLAQLGADVVINDINLNAAEEYDEALTAPSVMDEIKRMGRRSLSIQADVTQKAEVNAMMRKIIDSFGRIDILVNNAGGALRHPHDRPGTASEAHEDHYQYIMDINLTGSIFCCQAASTWMKTQKSGKMVNVSSQAGMWSGKDGGGMPYKVAKAGVIQYTRILAAELGPFGINVNCIAPGFIDTDMTRGLSESQRDALLAQIPLGRLGKVEDVAAAVVFLASQHAGYITGTTLHVNGGMYMN